MASGVPKIPTITARVPSPATVPQIGERHPRVLPTARTIVNASTHSTMLATKAGKAAMASVAKATLISDHSLCRTAKTMLRLYMILVTGDWAVKVLPYGSGALRPPPPVAAPLVPRYALLPAATPRDVLSARGTPIAPI